MTRREGILIAVIACELVVGAVLFWHLRSRPVPPEPGLSAVDALTARDLRELAGKCRSAGVVAGDWARLGEAYMAYGFFPEAEACCRQAAELEPTAQRAFDWAFALERLGLTEEANAQYVQAIERGHPAADDCWYFIGRNWLREEKADEARAAFQQAGEHPSSQYERARLLVRAGNYPRATALLQRLSAEHPLAVQPYLLRYRIEVLEGNEEQAAVHADRASRANSQLPTPFRREWGRLFAAYDSLGLAREGIAGQELLKEGKLDEAERRLRDALAVRWEAGGVDLLAEIELQRGRPHEAVWLLREVVERDGPAFDVLIRLGDALDEAGKTDDALKTWSRAAALRSGPETKDLHHRMATRYEKAGDTGAARRHMAQAYHGAGLEAMQKDDLADAALALQQAVVRDPNAAQSWFYLAEVRRLLGQTTAARQTYERCLSINPDHGRARAGLALLTR